MLKKIISFISENVFEESLAHDVELGIWYSKSKS